MEQNRGIEITRKGPTEVSVQVAGSTIRPQGQPTSIRLQPEAAFVYLLLDTSASMRSGKLERIKTGVLNFARDAFTRQYRVGLIAFSSSARHICSPTGDMSILEPHVQAMYIGGTTNMAEAIKVARYHLDKPGSTRVIVIATDGRPDNKKAALKEAEKAKSRGIDIITIGTDDANQDFLKQMATRAELGKKVPREAFSQAISSASNLLPPPAAITKL